MNDVVVFKATHHIDGGVGFTNVRQEFVAQTLACASASDQACNVHKLHNGRHDALWADDGRQLLQTWIGHFHHAGVGLDGTKRIVFSRYTSFGQGVEKGGLANVGQAHNATFEAHGRLSWILRIIRDFKGCAWSNFSP